LTLVAGQIAEIDVKVSELFSRKDDLGLICMRLRLRPQSLPESFSIDMRIKCSLEHTFKKVRNLALFQGYPISQTLDAGILDKDVSISIEVKRTFGTVLVLAL
jgi:hypothetical protein